MKTLLTIFIAIVLTLNSFCQISEGGKPYSFSHQNTIKINQTIDVQDSTISEMP